MRARRVAAALACVFIPTLPASAQGSFQPRPCKIAQADIDRAIAKGVEWLKATGCVNPAAGAERRGTSSDEIYFYTLYHGGLPKTDPLFQQYLKRLVDKEPRKTYEVALAALCLSELDKKGYQWKLEQYAQFLLDNQCENGQWAYGEPVPLDKKKVVLTPTSEPQTVSSGPSVPDAPAAKPAGGEPPLYGTQARAPDEAKKGTATQTKIRLRKRRTGPPKGDNSNSQYAALGLRACAEAGIEIDPRCVQLALQWWLKEQVSDGGWGYDGPDEPKDGKSWGSMSVGGIGAIAIYRWMRGEKWKNDPGLAKGLGWLGTNWDVTKNPFAAQNKPGRERWQYYYLYGIERAGMIYGTDDIGKHDWYGEGATYLLQQQHPNGAWKGDGRSEELWDTCFAILFLRRATRALVFTGAGS